MKNKIVHFLCSWLAQVYHWFIFKKNMLSLSQALVWINGRGKVILYSSKWLIVYRISCYLLHMWWCVMVDVFSMCTQWSRMFDACYWYWEALIAITCCVWLLCTCYIHQFVLNACIIMYGAISWFSQCLSCAIISCMCPQVTRTLSIVSVCNDE
jgi:hypothetical protein